MPELILSKDGIEQNSNYYHSVLEPLFFEILNTKIERRKDKFATTKIYRQIPYLNGGLFCPHADDLYKYDKASQGGAFGLVTIPDKWFEELYAILGEYNFTVDENTSYDIELSIDPEMLGRIFENLLAEISPETGESAKKSTGSFYTPRDIVDYMVDSSIYEYLNEKTGVDGNKLKAMISYGKEDDELACLSAQEKKKVVSALYDMTTLDPACGSGAFPIGLLQKIVYIFKEIDPTANLWFDKATEGMTNNFIKREFEKQFTANTLEYILKLSVIQNSIFGVDIQAIAVEIARLRCFLSLIIEEKIKDNEENRGVQPLPNLDFKFVIANSLIGLASENQVSFFEDQNHIEELKNIREEYFNATPERRIELKYEFTKIQNLMFDTTIKQYQKKASERYSQLSGWKPFENESTSWFDPEWMFGIKEGFDIVIANPPYVHLEKIESQIKELYKPFYTTYEARGDLYCLFYEMGVKSLKGKGFLTFITSNKWMRAGYGESLRNFFINNTNPIRLIDLGAGRFSSATVDTNIIVVQKAKNKRELKATTYRGLSLENMSDYIRQNEIGVDFKLVESWTILSPIEQSIKAKIEAVGTPLKEWDIKINRGILTGCNEAFIIDNSKRLEILSNCANEDERKRTDEIIRPILRGRDIKRYSHKWADLYLIAIFPAKQYNINDYPAVKQYLLDFGYDRLKQTGDKGARKKTNNKWFETQDSISYWDDFSKQKIVWSDIAREPTFAIINEHIYFNNTCYMIINSPTGLVDILNSKLIAWYFPKIATGLGDEGARYFKQFIENIPVPKTVGNRKYTDSAIFALYGLTEVEIALISSSVKAYS